MSGISVVAPEELFALEEKPTAQLIADHLREQIVQGSIRPGQQINEYFLASQLNMSRSPVREALQRLCQEGILVYRRNHGVFVSQIERDDLREIYKVRESVESAAAGRLLDGSPRQINDTCDVLQEIVSEMAVQVASSHQTAMARLELQFHSALVAGAGNSRFVRIYKTLAAESRMSNLELDCSHARMEVFLDEHQRIVDLLKARNREGLLKAIRRHMQTAIDELAATQQVAEPNP
jgi:DNA-binding GntR family transcriptional regulator